MRKKYQIFVSSTFEDLKDERQAVMMRLMMDGYIPAGMEYFPASPVDKWEFIKNVIDESDYVIVVAAGKYGSVDKDGKSFTEMECDYACEQGVPTLAFYRNRSKITIDRLDSSCEKINGFIDKLKQKICREWDTPDDLCNFISSALKQTIDSYPRPHSRQVIIYN
jgi:hypothetical protein